MDSGTRTAQRWSVADLPDEEALKALDRIERMLRAAERDARLLDGREFKARRWSEAYRLVGLLRERAGG